MESLNSTYIFTRARPRLTYIEKLIFLSLVIVTVGGLIWAFEWEMIDLERIRKSFVHAKPSAWINLAIPIVIMVVQFTALRLYRTTRLIVDQEGLRIKQTAKSIWSRMFFIERKMSWADLTKVSYVKSLGVIQLRRKAPASIWTLRIKDWEFPDEAAAIAQGLNVGAKIEPDLLRVFREAGIFEAFPKDSRFDVTDFDLMGHPATKAVLLAMAALGAYSVVDGLSQHEAWADYGPAYYLPHLVVGAIAMIALIVRLGIKEVHPAIPKGIAIGLAVVAGFVVGAASYVGGIRLNQWIGGPLIAAPYHRNASCDALIPEEVDLPVVDYSGLAKAYWCSIDATSTVNVNVRKGLFGLYQVDLTNHTQAIKQYRQTH